MPPSFADSTWTVARKEMMLNFKTKRLLVIGGVFAALIIIIALYGGYLTGQAQDEPTYEEGAANVMYIVFEFSVLMPPILAIALTYDAIVGEKANHSMYLLASKPVRRESIYLGKLLGAWLAVALVYLVVFSLGFAIVVGMAGTAPTADGVADVYGAIGIILLGTGAWMTLVMLFSSMFKTTASTLITSVLSWLFVLSLISQAGLIYYAVTISNQEVETNVIIDYAPMGGNKTILTFSGYAMINTRQISINITDEQGNAVLTEIPGAGNYTHSYVVERGTYSWAASLADDSSPADVFANGTVYVAPNAYMRFALAALDDDMYINDVTFAMTNESGGPFYGGEYSVSGNGTMTYAPLDFTTFEEKNLTEGPYVASVIAGWMPLLYTTFHSYGESLSGDLAIFAALSGTNDDAPGYVRTMYAINPSNCIVAYAYLFNPDYVGVLSMTESMGSLVAFSAVCMALGLLVFKRKGLA